MNILPIIVRELRAESRHRANYSLRLFGAAISTFLLGIFLWDKPSTQSGSSAFGILSFAVFCGIWIIVPLLTADCLSREKREGTLGLLFLTPLKPIEIVLGKGTIHALRSLTLLIAVIPIMTIPFTLGGITKSDVLWSLMFNFSALGLALAAGLLASSMCQQWTRAVVLAAIFSAVFALAFLEIVTASSFSGFGHISLLKKCEMLLSAFFVSSRARMFFPAPRLNQILPVSYSLLLTALLICMLVLLFAAGRLKSSWQDNPPSPRQLWFRKTFCTPRFWTGLLRRRNQSRLSRNPVGWLQQYSWSARLGKWGWCAVIIAIVSWFLAADFEILRGACVWLKSAMLISMAFSAVGSFQREKQNGALELLLVTPLREKQIIFGRLWGIWGQFLPAFGILLLTAFSVSGFYGYGSYFRMNMELNIPAAIRDFIIVPVVGLYLAMRLKNFMAAWILTCALTLFLPLLAPELIMQTLFHSGFYSYGNTTKTIARLGTLVMVALGFGSLSLLYSQLKNRTFALAR
jgi:ABC-type transport system involved in multi-copper enzyme maturation permease subunit